MHTHFLHRHLGLRCLAIAIPGLLLPIFSAQPASTTAATRTRLAWSGKSGGYVWQFSRRDLTARRAGAVTVFSAARRLRDGAYPEGSETSEVTASPLSLVGTLLSYREDHTWSGGAHPSGETQYRVIDAARSRKALVLTELFPDPEVLRALLGDPVIRKVMAREEIRAPRTSAALARALAGKGFGEDNVELSFPATLLRGFSFHHLEGNRVAVRLFVPWGTEANRFRPTEIGILLSIPEKLRKPLELASSRREGFLQSQAKGLFGNRDALLYYWERKPGE